jgi:hypothetical protein
MTGGAGAAIGLVALAAALCSLTISVLLARRYRELRTALLDAGVLAAVPAVSTRRPEGQFLPAAGSPVPPGLRMTATDGTSLDRGYFAGDDVIVAFMMDQCTSCTAQLPELRATLSRLPAAAPRPVVVLSGSPAACAKYRQAMEPVAYVVEDGPVKESGSVVRALRVHSFPAVLVLGGGVVRRSGMTAAEVAPATSR